MEETVLEQDILPTNTMDTLGTTVTIHPEGRITVVSKTKNKESI